MDKPWQRRAWRLLRSSTKAAARRRANHDELFEELFPGGHDYSLRDKVLSFSATAQAGESFADESHELKRIHPRAFSIIAAYGVDYRPHEAWDVLFHEDRTQPQPGGCCSNSRSQMRNWNARRTEDMPTMFYVEGITMGVRVRPVPPMLHAWNFLASKEKSMMFDWTLYSVSKWFRYIGVPFSQAEIVRIEEAVPGYLGLLFHKKTFPCVETLLVEILKERVPYRKPAA